MDLGVRDEVRNWVMGCGWDVGWEECGREFGGGGVVGPAGVGGIGRPRRIIFVGSTERSWTRRLVPSGTWRAFCFWFGLRYWAMS
jgi:hypothetical protein